MNTLKMGHWIDSSNGWMCSVCHRDNAYDIDFCPNCGADMRNISLGEAIEILEEVMELDDSIYAYNRKYRMALGFVIDCIKRDMADANSESEDA